MIGVLTEREVHNLYASLVPNNIIIATLYFI